MCFWKKVCNDSTYEFSPYVFIKTIVEFEIEEKKNFHIRKLSAYQKREAIISQSIEL